MERSVTDIGAVGDLEQSVTKQAENLFSAFENDSRYTLKLKASISNIRLINLLTA